ncbi:MAG TPA: hypothetical protein VEA92_00545 [Candidatus Paceibacterota bacterium]|nr:hypothetical protein [Candidatus Paceibacterota bacterium]
MDEPQQLSNVDDAVATALLRIPEPIREFVMSPERDRVALELMQKYGLHADQAGDFERAYLQMLLGVKTPDEFRDSLREAGIPEPSINGLTTDVNEMVFKPLRRKEQEQSERRPEPPRPVSPPSQIEAPPQYQVPQQPQPVYTPPIPGAQQQTYWVPVSITAVPQPYMTTQPPLQYQAPQQPPAPPPPPPPVPEPVIERPAPPPVTAWEPPPPPPNLPTEEGQRTPLTKDYAADPYREPF